jgi:segregation and condensation protein B
MLKEILRKIEEKYKNTDSAFELVVRGENYKLDVKREYSSFVNKLAAGKTEFTKAEQETLAIIAYKQPILQSVVVKIRGNKGYDHVKRLRDLGLVSAKSKRHTLELTLSDNFYEYFNISREKGAEEISEAINATEAKGEEGDVSLETST